MKNKDVRSLWELRAGQKCKILSYQSELEKDYQVRLMDLGFHPGEVVTCVQAPAFGAPKLFQVSNTVYSLDDWVAKKIKIEWSCE